MKELYGNSIQVVKEANAYLVLQCIMRKAPLSVEEIVQTTKLSRPTVINILKGLMDDGIVVKDGFAEAAVGRSAALLNLSSSGHLALGIDFEFPKVRMVVANMRGEILHSDSFVSSEDIGMEELKSTFYRRVQSFLASTGIPLTQFEGVGVGIAGVIDSAAGVSLSIERVRDWQNVAICQEL